MKILVILSSSSILKFHDYNQCNYYTFRFVKRNGTLNSVIIARQIHIFEIIEISCTLYSISSVEFIKHCLFSYFLINFKSDISDIITLFMAQNQQSIIKEQENIQQPSIQQQQIAPTSPSSLPNKQQISHQQPQHTQFSENKTHAPTLKKAHEKLFVNTGPGGHRKIVNIKGEQRKVYPSLNKFLLLAQAHEPKQNPYQIDFAGIFKQASQYRKQGFQKLYQVDGKSPIYNYSPDDIQLLGRRYDREMNPSQKKAIRWEKNVKNSMWTFSLCTMSLYTAFVFVSNQSIWSQLTTNILSRVFLAGHIFIFGIYFMRNSQFWQKERILRHHLQYEKVIQLYQSQQKVSLLI